MTAAAHPATGPRATDRAAVDLAAVRAAFPALERVHGGHPVAYFDGPGGTQVPRPVVEAMADYLYHHNANTHWAYPTSAETDAMLLAAREALADFVGAPGGAEEIAFGANMTTLTFHLARAVARGVRGRPLGPGDEIVATELDHHANVAPWRAAAAERGVALRVVRMDARRGCLDLDDLARAIGPRTRVVAIGAASNALGTVTDVASVAEMARAVGAITFVDAVHYAPHNLVDVASLGCDFLACSAYKFYGPHVGALWGKAELVAALDVPKLDPAPDVGAERLETGTQNHEGIVGAGAAVDFLAAIGGDGGTRRERLGRAFAGLHAEGSALLARLWEGLASVDGVTLYGLPPDAPRTPTLSFTVRGHTSEEVARRLAEEGVFVSHGDFYAATVIERLGVEGLVRAGCACYTSAEEVDRLVDGVRRLG